MIGVKNMPCASKLYNTLQDDFDHTPYQRSIHNKLMKGTSLYQIKEVQYHTCISPIVVHFP